MLIFYVDILCGYFMWMFYVDILCGYFMWIFYVDILCGYFMYSPKPIHSSIFGGSIPIRHSFNQEIQ